MNADVKIEIGVQAKKRYNDEPFRPTRTWSDSFNWTTTLDDYLVSTTTISSNMYTYVQGLIAGGSETQVHVAIRLANPTHPAPAKGVVPLPKGHIDFGLTGEEFSTASALQTLLNKHIADLKNTAKY